MTLNDVYTLDEAAKAWGIKYITLKQRFYRGVEKTLIQGVEYKRSGSIYLVTKKGMEKLYGPPAGIVKEIEITSLLEIPKAIKDLSMYTKEDKEILISKIFETINNRSADRKKFIYNYRSFEILETETGFILKIM